MILSVLCHMGSRLQKKKLYIHNIEMARSKTRRRQRSKRSKKKSHHLRMKKIRQTKQWARSKSNGILSSLKAMKNGGGRLDAWQDKYPMVGKAWDPSNNICKYPKLVTDTFYPPGQRGGRAKRRGGGNFVSETYFGRKPIGFVGPKPTPSPSKFWEPYSK